MNEIQHIKIYGMQLIGTYQEIYGYKYLHLNRRKAQCDGVGM